MIYTDLSFILHLIRMNMTTFKSSVGIIEKYFVTYDIYIFKCNRNLPFAIWLWLRHSEYCKTSNWLESAAKYKWRDTKKWQGTKNKILTKSFSLIQWRRHTFEFITFLTLQKMVGILSTTITAAFCWVEIWWVYHNNNHNNNNDNNNMIKFPYDLFTAMRRISSRVSMILTEDILHNPNWCRRAITLLCYPKAAPKVQTTSMKYCNVDCIQVPPGTQSRQLGQVIFVTVYIVMFSP